MAVQVKLAPTAQPVRRARSSWVAVAAVVALTALVARLIPLVSGGGFFGLGNYDDGVYFAAAIAFVHGEMPYRDFVLLHPPGIVLALTPFAALGRVLGEGVGWAAARLAWMLLGALSAVLVARILRPAGLTAALVGGLCYAVLYPAVYVETSTQLHGVANTFLLVGLALVVPRLDGRRASMLMLLIGGVFLAAGTTVKIWQVAAVAVVLAWQLRTQGVRRAAQVLLGFVLGGLAICLPFFLADPRAMWHDVVGAQLGRPGTGVEVLVRMQDIVGLRQYDTENALVPVVATVGVLVALVLAWRHASARLGVLLLVVLTAVLLVSPSWFQHYAALTAPPLALVVGAAAQTVTDWLRSLGNLAAVGATEVMVVVLLGYEVAFGVMSYGTVFPGRTLGRAVADLPGCVTTDHPATLIEMDVFGRNLDRGCAAMVDLNGYSYAMERTSGSPLPRRNDKIWQDLAMRHFCSGSTSIIIKYVNNNTLSKPNIASVKEWPVLDKVGKFKLLAPQAASCPTG